MKRWVVLSTDWLEADFLFLCGRFSVDHVTALGAGGRWCTCFCGLLGLKSLENGSSCSLNCGVRNAGECVAWQAVSPSSGTRHVCQLWPPRSGRVLSGCSRSPQAQTRCRGEPSTGLCSLLVEKATCGHIQKSNRRREPGRISCPPSHPRHPLPSQTARVSPCSRSGLQVRFRHSFLPSLLAPQL